jgi:hypothetical protein
VRDRTRVGAKGKRPLFTELPRGRVFSENSV